MQISGADNSITAIYREEELRAYGFSNDEIEDGIPDDEVLVGQLVNDALVCAADNEIVDINNFAGCRCRIEITKGHSNGLTVWKVIIRAGDNAGTGQEEKDELNEMIQDAEEWQEEKEDASPKPEVSFSGMSIDDAMNIAEIISSNGGIHAALYKYDGKYSIVAQVVKNTDPRILLSIAEYGIEHFVKTDRNSSEAARIREYGELICKDISKLAACTGR